MNSKKIEVSPGISHWEKEQHQAESKFVSQKDFRQF